LAVHPEQAVAQQATSRRLAHLGGGLRVLLRRDDPQRPAPLAGDETGLLSPAPDPVTPAAQHREGALHPVVELPGGLQWEPGVGRSALRALAVVPGVGDRLRLATRFVVPAAEDPEGDLAVHV